MNRLFGNSFFYKTVDHLSFFRIDELSKLNYSLDIELQKERGSREQMQAKLRLHGGTQRRAPQRSTPDRDSDS